jgi:hypothetical protein
MEFWNWKKIIHRPAAPAPNRRMLMKVKIGFLHSLLFMAVDVLSNRNGMDIGMKGRRNSESLLD